MNFSTIAVYFSTALFRISRRRTAYAFLGIAALCVTAFAQNVAQISGTVQDQSGAAIADAVVKFTQTDTSYIRAVKTEANGSYAAVNLPIGPYTLEVTQTGFGPYKQSGIVLDVNTNPKINVVLSLGSVTAEVNVEASAAAVETVSNAVGQVMDSKSVVDLPLNGRQVTDLLLLQAGAVQTGSIGNRGFPTVPIAIAGGGTGNNLYLLDGATHNDPGTNINMPVPFPDALQEFKVEASSLPARYGQHASAAVSLVTKSGTNEYHWVGFEFVRNRDFNARNFFALSRDPQKRNQFGGALGGPIKHDKLFFFGAYQGTILRTDPTTNIVYTPTAAEMAGDFTSVASPACNAGKQLTLKTPVGTSIPFANNMVSPAVFDQVSLGYMKYIPLSTDPCGKVQYGYPIPNHQNDLLGKVDYQRSDRHSIFVRYFWPHFVSPAYFDGKNALTTPSVGVNNRGHSLVGGDTFTINPHTINTFRSTVLLADNTRNGAGPFVTPTQLGALVTSTKLAADFTSLSITGGFGLGGSTNNPAEFDYTIFEAADTVDIIHGPHQFAFGVDYIHGNANYYNTQYSNGQFTFDGSQTGYGLADFLLGRVSALLDGPDGIRHDTSQYLGLFAQDTWKVTSRFTLNAGLRWDPFFPMHNQNSENGLPAQVLQFSQANFTAGKVSSIYTAAPAGLIFPGDAGYTAGSAMTTGHLVNFAPRVGLVFDPRGKGKETIRAGYGVFFDSPPMWQYNYVDTEAPWGPLITLNSVQFANPYANYAGGNPFPIKLSANSTFPTQGTFVREPGNSQPTYMQQWNISVQKQFFSNLLVTVTYLGNKTSHLWDVQDGNPALYIPGNCPAGQYGLTAAGACSTTANSNQRRLLYLQNPAIGQYYATFIVDNMGGNASYNSMVTSVQKRISSHFSVLGNYTWSHCINDDDPVSLNPGLNVSPSYSNPFNRKFDRGNCASDHRQVLNLSGALTSPNFSGRWLHLIGSGWQISPILQASSGGVLNLTSGRDVALDGSSSGQRVNVIGDPSLTNPTTGKWFNTSAFVLPTSGTFSNLGRNALTGPGYYVVNMALSRRFAIREKNFIEVRAEAFNLLNHVHLNNPTVAFTSAQFGQITTAGDPRIMQFAIKYTH